MNRNNNISRNATMLPPYYHPTYRSDVSSVEDSSSGDDDVHEYDEVSVENYDSSSRHVSECHVVSNDGFVECDPRVRQNRNNNPTNNIAFFPSTRVTVSNSEDQADLSMLRPSQVVNATGNSTMHATKGGQKLIGELYDSKNELYMNAMLREASREGFANTLCFPNRSKWLQTKVPIWFGSGGILGR
jgi:hypothetical protein